MRTLVAIPVYNEEKTIGKVLARARAHSGDLLIIDDGSTDGTWRALTPLSDVAVVRHRVNLGYGQSLIDAFEYALGEGYDCIVTLDADDQHEPEYIPSFLAEIATCDVVSGTRYPEGFDNVKNVPPDRLAINREITEIINRQTGYGLTDAFCGFKAYRTGGLAKVDLSEPGYGMCLEFWMKAAAAGLTVRELAIRRIYNDPTRTFGGRLEDADGRRRYYLGVIDRSAVGAERGRSSVCTCCGGCSSH